MPDISNNNSTENRKQKIINAAKFLFAKKGYSATGLREIADKAEVSLGNIYNHFKNKEEIFNHIFDPGIIVGTLIKAFENIVDDFPYNIDKVILSVKRVVDENSEIYRLSFIDLIEFGGKNTNRMIEYFLELAKDFFRERLIELSEQGVLKDLDFDFFSKEFIISLISFFSSSKVLPALNTDNYSDEEISKMIANVVLNGILK